MLKKIFYLLTILGAAICADTSESDHMLSSALLIMKECGEKPLIMCLKERALHFIDSQENSENVKITDGIQFIRSDDAEKLPSSGRSLNDVVLSNEPEARENEVDSLLVERVARFFGTHTLQFKIPKDSIEDMQRSLEEARGKKKKGKKYLLPILLLLKMKAAALLPLVIGFLALIAFKALVIGKIALLLSGIIGLKKLLESKQSNQNYEVVAHPHTSYEEHGHYKRSIDNITEGHVNSSGNNENSNIGYYPYAQNLAYSAYTKK